MDISRIQMQKAGRKHSEIVAVQGDLSLTRSKHSVLEISDSSQVR